MGVVKTISIRQPWATLLMVGEKRFETRSWATNYRGTLAIHASKTIDKAACRNDVFLKMLLKHGYDEKTLPTGVILGTCRLIQCYRVTENNGISAELENGYIVMGDEYWLGDFSTGRFAWELEERKIFELPVPVKGKLGLWNAPLHIN